MKAHELAKTLLAGPDKDIMILDGFNGGGIPRTINLGPCDQRPLPKQMQMKPPTVRVQSEKKFSSLGSVVIKGV
jgi:hypothetical protein